MNRIIRFLKLLKPLWYTTGRGNDRVFMYGTKDQSLINKFMELVKNRENEFHA